MHKSNRSKKSKSLQVAIVNIKSSFNNTLITVTDSFGNTVFHVSSGAKGFNGAKKATPYAAQIISESVKEWLQGAEVKAISINLKGPHNSRDAAIKTLATSQSYVITAIQDITPVPHNGCRARKPRRV